MPAQPTMRIASGGPLRSALFRGDKRLAAALVDHAKHVAPGDQGPHVAKIQCAVLMLEGGQISGAEAAAMRYGPTTAKAVLAYKTRRKIINFSYQNKPDNIVGIMTMRSLDNEMVLAELHDLRNGVRT
jgi:hypothetical protein